MTRAPVVLVAASLLLAGQSSAAAKHPAEIVVIGIDGVSLNLLEPFAEQGVTPNLAALMKEGARGHLDSIWPLRTPQVWTSAVTGKLPGQHGIWDHLSNTYYNPPPFGPKRRRGSPASNGVPRRCGCCWATKACARSRSVGWRRGPPRACPWA